MIKERERIRSINGWKLTYRSDLPEKFLNLCCMETREEGLGFEPVHSSRFTRVFCFKWGGTEYYLKEYIFQNWRKHRKVMSRGRHLARIESQLTEHDFLAPKVVCYAKKGRKVFVVSESANTACSVKEIYANPVEWGIADISSFRHGFGREVGRLHGAGFAHGDLRWGNILVRLLKDGSFEFIYIDNDRTRNYRRLPMRRRITSLVQVRLETIDRSNPISEWDEFWKGYCESSGLSGEKAAYLLSAVVLKTNRRLGCG